MLWTVPGSDADLLYAQYTFQNFHSGHCAMTTTSEVLEVAMGNHPMPGELRAASNEVMTMDFGGTGTGSDVGGHHRRAYDQGADAGNGRLGGQGTDHVMPAKTGGEYVDLDGDGRREYVVDSDHDGRPDAVWHDEGGFVKYDGDGDGVFDRFVFDHNRDGQVDEISFDHNNDGIFDQILLDTNHDGNFDREYLNKDGDLFTETANVDTNEDGIFDVTYHDVDGDGEVDIPM